MENTFVKLLRANREAVAAELKAADLLAMEDPASRYLVFVFDDGSARTLRQDADCGDPDLSGLSCVLAGSFCYAGCAPAPEEWQSRAAGRDYDAIVENCIMVLHHYR